MQFWYIYNHIRVREKFRRKEKKFKTMFFYNPLLFEVYLTR